jgi:dihydrofolate synthase/folylpolyglutamate synthase
VNFGKVCKYLDDCLIFGIKPSLTRIEKILKLLGNPHKKLDFIHIVGTNGKTSTATILAYILHQHGIRCGYHISPHINSYTERFWICGEQIKSGRFAKLFNGIYQYIKEVNDLDLGGPITQFEIIAAMAFKLAEDENLDVMVLEAGMGGRWDATNIADSKVAGLCGVSLEHTEILGDTISKITKEKVEVIKNKAAVATLSNDRKVLDILTRKVRETDSRLFIYNRDFRIINSQSANLGGWKLDIKGTAAEYRGLSLPLLGTYQPLNLSLAIVLAELYMDTVNKKVKEELLKESLREVKVLGRFEIIRSNPTVLADASHNPEGIINFIKNINKYFKGANKIVIFAVLGDKDYKTMIADVSKVTDVLILTSSQTDRSLDIDTLESEVKKILSIKKTGGSIPKEVYKIDNIGNSLNFALKISKSNDIICITGSITNLEGIV